MRAPFAAAALLLAACGDRGAAPDAAEAPGNAAAEAPAAEDGSDRWDLSSGSQGVTLAFVSRAGGTPVRFFCPSGRGELVVNVPGFRPVGSEERMTFGSGGEAATLVADTGGDAARGGVSGSGAVPPDLPALLAGPVAVNYGAQDSGPHPAPPSDLVRAFAAACRERAPAAPAPAPTPQPTPSGPVGACRMQDGERLANPPLRAIGTEPFWNARTEGRCVTYSHPDDIDGTRVWTAYRPGPDGAGAWSGALGGRLFELVVRPRPGCSDGMSDRRYPFEAELKVGGEVRRGCAEPA